LSEEREEFQSLSDQYVYLEALLKALNDQERLIAAYLQETEGSLAALRLLQGNFLASLGAGVFVQASLASQKVIVNIGQSVFVERPKEEVVAYLEKRREELQKSIQATQTKERQTIGAMQSMEPRLRELASKLGLARWFLRE
jgi:prefoldin alpha subunit